KISSSLLGTFEPGRIVGTVVYAWGGRGYRDCASATITPTSPATPTTAIAHRITLLIGSAPSAKCQVARAGTYAPGMCGCDETRSIRIPLDAGGIECFRCGVRCPESSTIRIC